MSHRRALRSADDGGSSLMETRTRNQRHLSSQRIRWTGQRVQFAFIDSSHLLDYVMTDFMTIDREPGIEGRCVVLRKTTDDRRHALRRQLVSY